MIDKEKLDRMERIFSKMRQIWYETNGQLRLCQLLFVVTDKDDLFYIEDDSLERQLDEFIDKYQG